jgi:hypothetical protein
MPTRNIPYFLRIMADAMEKSNLYLGETQQGEDETSAINVLIPDGDADCSCSVTVSRPVIIEALGRLGFTKVYEKRWTPNMS